MRQPPSSSASMAKCNAVEAEALLRFTHIVRSQPIVIVETSWITGVATPEHTATGAER
jgi:hypothetical protein